MKKILFMLSLAVLILITFGCSQNSPQTAQSNGEPNAKVKQEKSDYPNKPIELIVPTPPGGGADILARILAQHVPKYLPNEQSVVVINKTGGNNTIGVTEVFKAKPDGYTLGFIPTGPIADEPHFGNTPYTHDSFRAVMRVSQQDGFLYVRTDSPWETYEEWLQYVKENPGKFRVGTIAGTRNVLERLNMEAEMEMKVVPFDGFAEAVTALLGGHIEGAFATPTAVKAQIEAGEFRPLFSSSSRDIGVAPLLKDKGLDIVEHKVNGIIAPKDTPDEVFTIIHDAFKKALEDPEVIEQFKKVETDPYYAGPEEYQQILTESFETSGETLKMLGLIE